MSFPKKGNKFRGDGCAESLATQIAAALKRELGHTHAAVKTISAWTGAHERTAKQWLSGHICPRGDHLVRLVRHSDEVLGVVLRSAHRPDFEIPRKFEQVRSLLVELLTLVERSHEIWSVLDDAEGMRDCTSRRAKAHA
jgi:hypothetical protein